MNNQQYSLIYDCKVSINDWDIKFNTSIFSNPVNTIKMLHDNNIKIGLSINPHLLVHIASNNSSNVPTPPGVTIIASLFLMLF